MQQAKIPIKQKVDLLQTVVDESNFNLLIDKILQQIMTEHQNKLARYDNDLKQFETRYQMTSLEFYEKFENGLLGDEMDFFEWSGLIELKNDLLEKLNKLGRFYQ
ncbi:conserved hypothetical protein [Candidatus Magnetomoraceae bacterium gMMP-15]